MSLHARLLLFLALAGPVSLYAETAAEALKSRRWSDAARLADATLAASPDDREARLVRGHARARLKDQAGSLADFVAVLGQHPEDPRAWHGAGKTLRMMGDLAAGLAANERALALAPDEADYLIERGVNLFNAHAFGPSSAAFERVHALVPSYPGINAYRAELFLFMKDAAAAKAAAAEGLSREPDYGIHRINLAHAALFAGEMAEARRLYLECADLIDMDGVTPGRALVPLDFAKMRAAGVTVPGMEEIEAMLKK
jgi:tetratricopeptide (TPR) repeat protein